MLQACIFALREFSSCMSALDLLKLICAAIKQKGCPETYFEELLLLRPQHRGEIHKDVSGLQAFNFFCSLQSPRWLCSVSMGRDGGAVLQGSVEKSLTSLTSW